MLEMRTVDATTTDGGETPTAITKDPLCVSSGSLDDMYALGSASAHDEEGRVFSRNTGCFEGFLRTKMSVGLFVLTLFLSALMLTAVGTLAGCRCLIDARLVEDGGHGLLASPQNGECINVFTVDNFSDAHRFGGDIIAFSSALCYCDGNAIKRKRHGGSEKNDDGWIMFGSLSEGESTKFPEGVDILYCLHYGLLSEPDGVRKLAPALGKITAGDENEAVYRNSEGVTVTVEFADVLHVEDLCVEVATAEIAKRLVSGRYALADGALAPLEYSHTCSCRGGIKVDKAALAGGIVKPLEETSDEIREEVICVTDEGNTRGKERSRHLEENWGGCPPGVSERYYTVEPKIHRLHWYQIHIRNVNWVDEVDDPDVRRRYDCPTSAYGGQNAARGYVRIKNGGVSKTVKMTVVGCGSVQDQFMHMFGLPHWLATHNGLNFRNEGNKLVPCVWQNSGGTSVRTSYPSPGSCDIYLKPTKVTVPGIVPVGDSAGGLCYPPKF